MLQNGHSTRIETTQNRGIDVRKLVYFVATTLDGFIAHEDGSLAGFPWDDEYGAYLFESFPETVPAHLRSGNLTRADNRNFDAVLMLRKTYKVGLREGVTCPYPTLDQFVFSRTMKASPDKNVELVQEDAVAAVTELKKYEGRAIWLCGGAKLATALFAVELIDLLLVKLNPVFFGSGTPLFEESIGQKDLQLTDSKEFKGGHRILRYRISW